MNTMILAVHAANLKREEFPFRVVKGTSPHWPRKKNNNAVGIARDIATGEKVGKIAGTPLMPRSGFSMKVS